MPAILKLKRDNMTKREAVKSYLLLLAILVLLGVVIGLPTYAVITDDSPRREFPRTEAERRQLLEEEKGDLGW